MKCSPRRSGFTIIELLLALFLTSLLTAALSLMIGLAATDRRAMLKPTAEPAWMVAALDRLERDLHSARWWAGTDDRLVLIGQGRDGNPAHIEYHWQQKGDQNLWLRQENPLISTRHADLRSSRSLLVLNPSGITIGPHIYGDSLRSTGLRATAKTGSTETNSGAAIVVEGRRVALRALPDQIDITLRAPFADEVSRTVTRKVVLR